MNDHAMTMLLVWTFASALVAPLAGLCGGTIAISFACSLVGMSIVTDALAIFNAFICHNVTGMVLSVSYEIIAVLLISAYAVYTLYCCMVLDLKDGGKYGIFRRYVRDMPFPRKLATIISMMWSYAVRHVFRRKEKDRP